jgi:hypothetical protein
MRTLVGRAACDLSERAVPYGVDSVCIEEWRYVNGTYSREVGL